ncbi:MAG: L-lysine 6-transaminase [Chitinivibrionia bacterium]|nr:L-lysine 6-transaminase [Chitinivibrionia bacterium]
MGKIRKVSNASAIGPGDVRSTLGKHLQVGGFPIVVDLERSAGCRLADALSGKSYLDFFMFYATMPLGFNHPRLCDGEFLSAAEAAAVNNPSNTDYYTVAMAEFVDTMDRVAIPRELPNVFLIGGGALAVENALKTAFDWKIRKNFLKGAAKEIGTQVIHFREAFHGRSGYTLSLTNTNPAKTAYFPKFSWPRIPNPKIIFPLEEHIAEAAAAEEQALGLIRDAIAEHGNDIAALIIEPIQGEGGDNHFRPEFMQALRAVTEENDILFILDEVQTGAGMTGAFWAYEHTGMTPDIIAFGKKLQVCGIMASNRINEVESVFKVSSRINSTWGGSLVDMVRATYILRIIEEERLVENARAAGARFVAELEACGGRYPGLVSNVRGKGLMAALDLPDPDTRAAFVKKVFNNGMIIAPCGTRSVRFRPPLNVNAAEIGEAIAILDRSLEGMP